MPKSKTSKPAAEHIDLATLRETLLYMFDDVRSQAGLERIAKAMKLTISEIDLADAQAKLPQLKIIRNARFITRSY